MKKSFAMMIFSFLVAGFVYAEVLIDQTFDDDSGRVSVSGPLKRAQFVRVEPGSGAIGADPAVHFKDESTDESGILEYNAGDEPAGAYLISFDLQNNAPALEKSSGRVIFSMGLWMDGKSFILTGGAKRAFSVEFDQFGSSRALNIRIGKTAVKKGSYDTAALQQVKIWVNDNDQNELSYIRPDTRQEAFLGPDSVVVWINGELVADQLSGGIPMQASRSSGDAVLGRLGFSSSSKTVADFSIDNLHVESIAPQGAGHS